MVKYEQSVWLIFSVLRFFLTLPYIPTNLACNQPCEKCEYNVQLDCSDITL